MKKLPFLVHLGWWLLLTACAVPAPTSTVTQGAAPVLPPTRMGFVSRTPAPILPGKLSYSPSATITPSPSQSPAASPSPLPTLTPTWAIHPPGDLVVPILLYHHIAEPPDDNRYYVSPEAFKLQMEGLAASGYTTISMATLVQVMDNGGPLPARPVVITFDDGNLDVYQNAFPVMKALGFTGTVYIITKSLDDPKYMSLDVLKALVQSGWEVGSHTHSHSDLTTSTEGLKAELSKSRKDLEAALGVPVTSISYPFGISNDYIMKKAIEYGYTSGAGLGGGLDHKPGSEMYLRRIEVRESYSLGMFGGLLPWWNGTIEPTPTNTRLP